MLVGAVIVLTPSSMGAVQAMGPGTGSGMVTVHASYASWLVTSTLWLLSYTKFTVSPETRREVY